MGLKYSKRGCEANSQGQHVAVLFQLHLSVPVVPVQNPAEIRPFHLICAAHTAQFKTPPGWHCWRGLKLTWPQKDRLALPRERLPHLAQHANVLAGRRFGEEGVERLRGAPCRAPSQFKPLLSQY
eukprot:3568165-Rhodomonas_salina.1